MIKNKGPFVIGIFVFFLVFTIAFALENVLENKVSFNEKSPYLERFLNNKVVFFNNGYLNYFDYIESISGADGKDHNKTESYNKLIYYDMNGSLVKEVNIPYFDFFSMSTNGFDNMLVFDKNIYVFGTEIHSGDDTSDDRYALYIYKYDENLNEVSHIVVYDFDEKFNCLYHVNSEGNVYVYINYYSGKNTIIKIDNQLNNYEEIGSSSENIAKYFPALLLKNKLNLDNSIDFEVSDEYYDMKDIDNYVISSSKETRSGQNEQHTAYLRYVMDGELSFELYNEDYKRFLNPRLYNNLIFVLGVYNSTLIGYKSDILVYDLSGNLLQVIENNSVNMSYDIKDDKIILARNYFDGELIVSYYNYFKRHKIYFYNDMYKINEEFLGSSITNKPNGSKPVEDIDNPETKDFAIIFMIVVSVFSFMYFFIINKNKKIINK